MTIMSENPCLEVGSGEEARCRKAEEEEMGAAPCGEVGKHRPDSADPADRKKKRRRKTKRKAPYSKTESRQGRKVPKRRYKQPEAPYNSNRFLIEDHNDLRDVDVLMQERRGNRNRDSSFTSHESDEDFYYSSPEDEEEFLSKEFSNTYKDLHVETLASLSKAELIQHVLSLEERMDVTQKRLEALSEGGSPKEEVAKLLLANRNLLRENERLRRHRATQSSSEDSESDSSTSSSSSSSSTCSSSSGEELCNGRVQVNGSRPHRQESSKDGQDTSQQETKHAQESDSQQEKEPPRMDTSSIT